jgi:glycerol-1-phosphate dehydrogenase [NAD(P)+]
VPAVAGDLLQEILEQAGRGPLACACGVAHRVAVRQVLLEAGALERAAGLLRGGRGAGAGLWVLSDENTEAAAGARFKDAIRPIRIASRVLPAAPRPIPTAELAASLAAEVREARPDLLVGVGSGVVSDMVKRVSLETGIANWSVATAPSVDAYTSATAALRVGAAHRALPARPSEVVVCDLDVLARAPRPLVLAGLGDLLAKFPASLDWGLSRLLTGERGCEAIAGWALESARQALAAARRLDADPPGATRALSQALLVSGLAMQAYGSSRPAASAEHTIAHYWESVHAVADPWLDLHGILVGAASRLVLRGYAAWYSRPAAQVPDRAARLEARARERPWRDGLDEGMRAFEGRIAEEMAGREGEAATLGSRLDAFAAGRGRIAALAAPLLAELGEAVLLLEGLGFPFAPEALGIDLAHRLLPLRHVRLLRNRYTTFDLAHDLGDEEALIAAAAGA